MIVLLSDPAPTVKAALNCPLVLTVHAGSPDVSITSPVDDEVIVHPVSVGRNPLPVTVTTVAGAPGEPPAGGEPIVTLRLTLGAGVNVFEDVPESPSAPVTVIV
jgi:hypothetical protein